MPDLSDFIRPADLTDLIARARHEDLGPLNLDATTSLFVDAAETCTAHVVSRQTGTLAGLALLPAVVAAYDATISLDTSTTDGAAIKLGNTVASFKGSLRSILTLERVALNLLGHLSGIATHTAAFATQIKHTSAKVYDTRKTLPGLRSLQKYAVACGGGGTHRMGLYDAVMVKDNHLAHVALDDYTATLQAMAQQARHDVPALKFVMVEVDTLEQLDRVLPAGVDIVLLDNMPPDILKQAVAKRNAIAPNIKLEASGGITLNTVKAIAETGVERISVGALTHSSINLDLGLDIQTHSSHGGAA
ncbi:MAG: carboxylating nicotinate-nucleotide diphosphorylase [Algisphaera sp.]